MRIKRYLSINLEPDYKTLKAIEEKDSGYVPDTTKSATPAPRTVDTTEDIIPF